MDCHAARHTLLLDLYGEIATEERGVLEAHLGACDECRLAAAGERRLHSILGERLAEQPPDELLDRCRRDLALALDAEPTPLRPITQRLTASRVRPAFRPPRGLALLIAVPPVPRPCAATPGTRGRTKTAPRGRRTVSGAPLAALMSLESAPDRDHIRLSYTTRCSAAP
jgi:anti-sigma factor RsiW